MFIDNQRADNHDESLGSSNCGTRNLTSVNGQWLVKVETWLKLAQWPFLLLVEARQSQSLEAQQ